MPTPAVIKHEVLKHPCPVCGGRLVAHCKGNDFDCTWVFCQQDLLIIDVLKQIAIGFDPEPDKGWYTIIWPKDDESGKGAE